MSYSIYLATHKDSGKQFVGYTANPSIADGFAVRQYRGGTFNHLVREQGVEAFTLTCLHVVNGLPQAIEKLASYAIKFNCYEPKGFNSKINLNAIYPREVFRSKFPLGSKPWHNKTLSSNRKSRESTVTRFVRREIDNGVTDYSTLLNRVISSLRDGSINKKPASWLIIHSIIKQALMEKVYTPKGFTRWTQVRSKDIPAFSTLPSLAPDLNIRLGGEIAPIVVVGEKRRRGRPRKIRPLVTEPKPPRKKRELSPENKMKMIAGLKRWHRERNMARSGFAAPVPAPVVVEVPVAVAVEEAPVVSAPVVEPPVIRANKTG